MRFEVKSAAPVAVSVSGLFKGKAVINDGGTSAPAMLPAGGGIGVVSFFYWGEKPTRIDEVRLKISAAQGGAPGAEYAFPVTLTWLSDDAAPRAPAAWVKAWRQAQETPLKSEHGTGIATGMGVWLALATGGGLLAIASVWMRRRARADDGTSRR